MNEFAEFIIEQLRAVPALESRRMFGSVGLYSAGKFFGIISDGRVYFKTHAGNSQDYIEAGMEPFKASEKQTLINYYEVPPDILENPDKLAIWVGKSIARK